MHRIEYEKIYEKYGKLLFENDYLIALGLATYTETGKFSFTKKYDELNAKWKKLSSFKILHRELKDILIADYERLVDIFLNLKNISYSSKTKLKETFDYNKHSQSMLSPLSRHFSPKITNSRRPFHLKVYFQETIPVRRPHRGSYNPIPDESFRC